MDVEEVGSFIDREARVEDGNISASTMPGAMILKASAQQATHGRGTRRDLQTNAILFRDDAALRITRALLRVACLGRARPRLQTARSEICKIWPTARSCSTLHCQNYKCDSRPRGYRRIGGGKMCKVLTGWLGGMKEAVLSQQQLC